MSITGYEAKMTEISREKLADIPSGTDEQAPDSADAKRADSSTPEGGEAREIHKQPNPPHTTTGRNFTAPKFGSAGSGGLEYEPGLDVD